MGKKRRTTSEGQLELAIPNVLPEYVPPPPRPSPPRGPRGSGRDATGRAGRAPRRPLPPGAKRAAITRRNRTPRIPHWTPNRIRDYFAKIADKKLVARFIEYHLANGDVYEDFVDRSFRALRTGRLRYSQWTIIQSVRWDRDMKTRGDVFKINNDYIALYVRMAIADFPLKLMHFFELRKMKPVGRKMSREEKHRTDEREEREGR